MRLGHVVLVARETLRDTFRERGVLRAMILVPLVVWLVIGVGPVLASSSSSHSDANLHATLLVPIATPSAIVDVLDDHLRVLVREDPEQELTIGNGDAVMSFGRNSAAALRAGDSVRVREVTSDRTKGAMTIAIAESELTTAAVRFDNGTPIEQKVTRIKLRDPTEARSLLARSLPMFYVLLLGSIVQIAASRFQTGRSLRTLEMLLVRPFRRSELLAGLGASAGLLGLVSGAVVLVPFTALALLTAAGDGAGSVIGSAAVLIVIVVSLCALFAGFGLALGVSGKTVAATQGRTGLAVLLLMSIALAVQLSSAVAKMHWLTWAPFTSALILIRTTLATGPSLSALVRVVVVTTVATAACFAYAGRLLDSERVTTRA